MTKPKRRRSRRLGIVVALGCLVVAAVLVWIFGHDALDMWKNSQTEEQTRALYAAAMMTENNAAVSPAPSPMSDHDRLALPSSAEPEQPQSTSQPTPSPLATATATPTPEPTPEVTFAPELPPVPTPPPVHADFLELYGQNNHLIGWLQAGDNINHPVVWDEGDNDFYLHHDFFKKSDNNGTLFLNGNNSFFPPNDVWLIHGHNMRGGGMFGRLGNFRKEAYLYEHPLVVFRTIYDAEPVYYVPIAAFDASMRKGNRDYFNITQIAFPDDEAFQTYLDSLKEWSLWESPAGVNVDDQLLMLVTCSYYQDDGRFMLVCRKLREGETPESVQAMFVPEEE